MNDNVIYASREAAKKMINALNPNARVDMSLVDEDTGEIYIEIGDLPTKSQLHRDHTPKSVSRTWKNHIVVDAQEGTEDFVSTFESLYDVSFASLADILDDQPEDSPVWLEYDRDMNVPIHARRKDGLPISDHDVGNARDYVVSWTRVNNTAYGPTIELNLTGRVKPGNLIEFFSSLI